MKTKIHKQLSKIAQDRLDAMKSEMHTLEDMIAQQQRLDRENFKRQFPFLKELGIKLSDLDNGE